MGQMEDMSKQHLYWIAIRQNTCKARKTYHVCQLTKQITFKYGKLRVEENFERPWEILCVDLIGPYATNPKGEYNIGHKKNDLTLWCLTMIYPVMNWL